MSLTEDLQEISAWADPSLAQQTMREAADRIAQLEAVVEAARLALIVLDSLSLQIRGTHSQGIREVLAIALEALEQKETP